MTKFKYPEIEPSCMASLETLLNKTITVQDVMFLLLYAIKDLGGVLNMTPIGSGARKRRGQRFQRLSR